MKKATVVHLKMDYPKHEVIELPNSSLHIQEDGALFIFNKERDSRTMTQGLE